VQVVVGRADRARVDHEGTLLERARLLSEETAAHLATERGLVAFAQLLRLAEEEHHCESGRQLVAFLGAVWTGQPLRLAILRAARPEVGDDMLAVLDAFRYARLNLAEQVEGGAARVARVLSRPGQDPAR
jgi:hypothetical protein